MPPVLLDLPVPYPPTGLYARQMDPVALDDLGFQRETVACAMLRVPTPEAINHAEEAVANLAETHRRASSDATRAGLRCTCEVADSIGLRALVFGCATQEAQPNCEVESRQAGVRDALQPVIEALRDTPPPVVHWRIAGKTDRANWFPEHESLLLPRHTGGSTFYVRGQAVPARKNYELVRELLEVEGVTAVVRQDGGKALVVVRELGKELIIDHFSHPAISNDRVPLLAALDNAHAEHYKALLEKPTERRSLVFEPQDGTMLEIDRPLLEEVDRLILSAAPLAGGYNLDRERRVEPTVLIDRVAIQAPYGKKGQVLKARIQLNADGQGWANTLQDEVLSPTLDELGLSGDPIVFEPDPNIPSDLPFVLRGAVTNEQLIQGFHGIPSLMRQIEMRHPNTVQGKASAWKFIMPPDDLESFVGEDGRAMGLRQGFFDRAYVVEMSFDQGREAITVEAKPK